MLKMELDFQVRYTMKGLERSILLEWRPEARRQARPKATWTRIVEEERRVSVGCSQGDCQGSSSRSKWIEGECRSTFHGMEKCTLILKYTRQIAT